MSEIDDEKEATIDRLKTYITKLRGQLAGLQTELKTWVKKYGRTESLMTRNGGGEK